jgi:DNA-binding transcriptional LysR family regulator
VALDPHLLRVFAAVARAGSVTAGAAALHRSQPAVSAALQRLEGAFGEPLLERGPRGVRPTPWGARLLPHAEALERLLAGVEELAREAAALSSGALRLAASTTIATYWLPPLLADFHALHPGLRLAVRTRNSREAIAELTAGEVDLALVEGPAASWGHLGPAAVVAAPIHRDELVVVVRPEHPFAGRARLLPADLDGVPWVGRERGSGSREVVERVLADAGVRPDVRIEMSEPEAMKRAVRAGWGAAFLSRIAVAEEVAAGELVVVPCAHAGLQRDFTLLHPPAALAGRAARAFIAAALAWDDRAAAGAGVGSGAP